MEKNGFHNLATDIDQTLLNVNPDSRFHMEMESCGKESKRYHWKIIGVIWRAILLQTEIITLQVLNYLVKGIISHFKLCVQFQCTSYVSKNLLCFFYTLQISN